MRLSSWIIFVVVVGYWLLFLSLLFSDVSLMTMSVFVTDSLCIDD